MRVAILAAMGWMLLRSAAAMDAASAACRLFATGVLPGLFPYMVLAQLLVSRMAGKFRPGLLMLLGWCGGSPTGARLMQQTGLSDRRLAVRCATMSPMFLAGTCGQWLNSAFAGWIVLLAVLIGGYAAGWLVRSSGGELTLTAQPVSFGQAVESSARTMLMVCGTMVMMRVLSALVAEAMPLSAALPLCTVLEVTTGIREIAALPLPLVWRTALVAGAAGFGGCAVILQNRALYPQGMLRLPRQIASPSIAHMDTKSLGHSAYIAPLDSSKSSTA